MRVVDTRKMTNSNITNNEFFDLQHLGALEVIGERASEFLQGQLTCDLRNVNATKMQQGAFCSVNGRILAMLDVVELQGLHLILPHDLCAPTQASLAKAALFSQVKITVSNKWRVFGLKLNDSASLLPFGLSWPVGLNEVSSGNGCYCYRIHGDLYMLLIETTAYNQVVNWLYAVGWQILDPLSWHVLQLQAQRARIYPESRGLFFPHRIGLQNTGYISFNKGCYRGQEIIARMHYRAQLKHELRIVTIESQVELVPGNPIISPVTQDKIGEIIDFCRVAPNSYYVMISVLRDHVGSVLPADVAI